MVTPAGAQHQPLAARTELKHVVAAGRARRADDGAVDKHAAHLAQRPHLARGLLLGGARGRAEDVQCRVVLSLLLLGVFVVVVVVVVDGQHRVAAAPRRHA